MRDRRVYKGEIRLVLKKYRYFIRFGNILPNSRPACGGLPVSHLFRACFACSGHSPGWRCPLFLPRDGFDVPDFVNFRSFRCRLDLFLRGSDLISGANLPCFGPVLDLFWLFYLFCACFTCFSFRDCRKSRKNCHREKCKPSQEKRHSAFSNT